MRKKSRAVNGDLDNEWTALMCCDSLTPPPSQSWVPYNSLCPSWRAKASTSRQRAVHVQVHISSRVLIQFGAALRELLSVGENEWSEATVFLLLLHGQQGGWMLVYLISSWKYYHHSCIADCHMWRVSSAAPHNYAEKQPAITAERLSTTHHCGSSIATHNSLSQWNS